VKASGKEKDGDGCATINPLVSIDTTALNKISNYLHFYSQALTPTF